jgi:hypothetical protein
MVNTSACHIHFIDQSFYWSLIIGSYTNNCVERERPCLYTHKERAREMRDWSIIWSICVPVWLEWLLFPLFNVIYNSFPSFAYYIYDILFKSERPIYSMMDRHFRLIWFLSHFFWKEENVKHARKSNSFFFSISISC